MLWVIGNVASAVGLILVNKWVISKDHFNHPTTLSCLHFYFSFLACHILLFLKVIKYKPATRFVFVVRIAMGALGSTILMNMNLASNSVGFYQMSKLACIPCTLLFETLLDVRQQQLTPLLASSLILIVVGVWFFAISDISVNFVGSVWAILAVGCSSIAQVLFSPLQKELQLDALQLLLHTSPLLTLGSFLIVPIFEDRIKLFQTTFSLPLVRDIGLSCILAVLLNISNYYILSETSPLTYLIIGHIKTIIIILLGALFFDSSIITPKIACGVGIALGGVILYSFENRQQQQKRMEAPLSKV